MKGGTMRNGNTGSVRPKARSGELVVEELDGEVLVYDLESHRAHCLNGASALVWRACDGTKTVPELTSLVEGSIPGWDEDTTNYALAQLSRRHLLVDPLPAPERTLTRRDIFRKAAIGGLAVGVGIPIVKSIVAPTPAHAASCLPTGSGCSSSAQCCSGLCVAGICL
jgi:hypothetical protein